MCGYVGRSPTVHVFWFFFPDDHTQPTYEILHGSNISQRIQQSLLRYFVVCFEAVAREIDDVSNNRLKCADVSVIRLPFNYNL